MIFLLLGLMLASVSADGRELAAYRVDVEKFLRKARITETRDIGEGVSKPLKVYLERDGREMKAIFKDVDTFMKGDARHGGETVDQYIDSYKSEIAAYELDKLIGYGQLPVIVERRVKKREGFKKNGRGSLRVWVDDVKPRYGPGQRLEPDERLERWVHAFWLFDYLIYNVDRGTHNVMLANDWSPVNIDNSMCFNTFVKPIRPLYRFPREIVVRLRALEPKDLKKAMKKYLNKKQIAALQERIDHVLESVDHRISVEGEDAVLFSLD